MKEEYLKEGLKIVNTLNCLTYQAYIVGGAVRDFIMKNDFIDIDIATSATPEEINKIFPNVRMEYADLGFVTIKKDDMIFEVSTFKQEIYDNVRKPSKIYYSNNLLDDVLRRDFTVNALALTDKMEVVDLVHGVKDLKKKKVQVIGNAKARFGEDPIRILRAYELVARFNFHISIKTKNGILKQNKLLKEISNYQISKAINKIFTSPYGKKAVNLMVEYKTNRVLDDYNEGLFILAKNFKHLDLVEKLSLCFAYKNSIPINTCFDKVTLTKIKEILEVVDATKDFDDTYVVNGKDIINYGYDTFMSAVKINQLIRKKYPHLTSKIKNVYKRLTIHSLKELKIKGSDIVSLNGGVSGQYVGNIIKELAEEVVIGMIQNDYLALSTRTKEILESMKPTNDITLNKGNDLSDIKLRFDKEFSEKVEMTLESLTKGDETEEELSDLRVRVEEKVKESLVNKNEEYQLLRKEGLI